MVWSLGEKECERLGISMQKYGDMSLPEPSLPERSLPELSLPEPSLPEHLQNRQFRNRHFRNPNPHANSNPNSSRSIIITVPEVTVPEVTVFASVPEVTVPESLVCNSFGLPVAILLPSINAALIAEPILHFIPKCRESLMSKTTI